MCYVIDDNKDKNSNRVPLREWPTEESTVYLLRELVAHLRDNRSKFREEWVRRITESQFLTAMTQAEIVAEVNSVFENYVEALKLGMYEALQAFSRNLSERFISRGVEPHEIIGIVFLLRDILDRSLFAKYKDDFDKLNRILDVFESATNQIAYAVSLGFNEEQERVIREQQQTIHELSTPVLQVRERMLILPLIGIIDTQRARHMTKRLLYAIRNHRAKVVIMDLTKVATMDSNVANHLVQTIDAARLLGSTIIVTGLSEELAQTLVTIGVDLAKIITEDDLQSGLKEAERQLRPKVQ